MFLQDKRLIRIAVAIVGLLVAVSLVLMMVQGVGAATRPASAADAAHVPAAPSSPAPSAGPSGEPSVGAGKPPKTNTPQGQATQVTDNEHVGGLIGYIVFMAGGLALLVRGHRRRRAELAAQDGAAASGSASTRSSAASTSSKASATSRS